MGRPLRFDYHVQLGPRGDGYPIRDQRCAPAAGDDGHTLHVRLHDDGDAADGRHRPRDSRSLGEPLDACSPGQRPVRRPAATATPRAACTSGGWCSKRFTTRSPSEHATPRRLGAHEETATRRSQDTAAARRRRHGHAAHARRARTGRLRRGVEPDASRTVLAIQRRYAEAGSDCILTNTFGGSRIMLNRHGHADDVARDQPGRRRDRARGVRRHATATCSATSARSAA